VHWPFSIPINDTHFIVMKLNAFQRPTEAVWLSLRPRLWITAFLIGLSVAQGFTALFGVTAFVPLIELMGGKSANFATQVPFVRNLIDLLGGYGPTTFYWLVCIIVLLGIARGVLQFAFQYYVQRLKLFVIADWQKRVVFKWVNAPYEEHSRQRSAALLNLTANEVGHMGNSISAVVSGVGAALQIAIALLFLAMVSTSVLVGLFLALMVMIVLN
ncbi:unnamed protein product, partial [marine sediment metagenome]